MDRALKIGSLKIKNRLIVPPMVCFTWPDEKGYVTEKNLKHYEDLAKGGFGLIIVEATAITERSKLHESELGIWEDGQIAGMKEITERIHAHGAKAFIQLLHAGINGVDPEAETASDTPERRGIRGHEMSPERIRRTVEDFTSAAVRAEKAGFDGVELHGCHGYLLSQFMNSRINHRTDAYGKDPTLLCKEIIASVRKACRPGFVVGIRLGAFEPKLEDGLAHAAQLAPLVDFLNISYGGDCDPEKPEDFPCSAAVYGAMRIKEQNPGVPVFGVDGINSREDVIAALGTGIDGAVIGRAALVDPAFAAHVLAGEKAGRCLHCRGCRWNPDGMKDPDKICGGAVLFEK